jgi:hypothetical protein
MVQHGESWVLILVFFWANGASTESGYPDLRNAHDPELQKAKDKALGPSHPEFWDGVHKKEFSVVIADVTDLHHPQVAWYNPDLMHGLSHGASAMQAARFYYGLMTGTIINIKYQPLFWEIFGNPAIKHKFVKGLQGREDVEIYRKSGTWRKYHADSGVVVHEDFTDIVVYIDHHPDAGTGAVKGIRIVDDVMKAYNNISCFFVGFVAIFISCWADSIVVAEMYFH